MLESSTGLAQLTAYQLSRASSSGWNKCKIRALKAFNQPFTRNIIVFFNRKDWNFQTGNYWSAVLPSFATRQPGLGGNFPFSKGPVLWNKTVEKGVFLLTYQKQYFSIHNLKLSFKSSPQRNLKHKMKGCE